MPLIVIKLSIFKHNIKNLKVYLYGLVYSANLSTYLYHLEVYERFFETFKDNYVNYARLKGT